MECIKTVRAVLHLRAFYKQGNGSKGNTLLSLVHTRMRKVRLEEFKLPCSIYKTELGNSSMFIKRHGPPSSITVIFLDFMCNLLTYFTLTLHLTSHYFLKRVAYSYRFLRHPFLFLLPFTSLTYPSSFSNPFYLT